MRRYAWTILILAILACGCSRIVHKDVTYTTLFQDDDWRIEFYEAGGIKSIEFIRDSDPAARFVESAVKAAVAAGMKGAAP